MQAEGRTIFVGDQTVERTMPQFVLRQRVSIGTAYDLNK
jgi:hypothetical protein